MEYSITDRPPTRWIVVLVGHFEDIDLAIQAIEENQKEAWIGFSSEGDDDERTVTITLRWIDIAMTRLVRSIIESDFPHVAIKANRGEYNYEGDQIA